MESRLIDVRTTPIPFSTGQTAEAWILSLINIGTILGNGFIFLLFIKKKSLRTVQNYLVLSLAVTDFCLGAFKLGVQLPNAIAGEFAIGYVGCQVGAYADLAFCVSSWVAVGSLGSMSYVIFSPTSAKA